jgi:spoIIIJ-associated protein
MLYKKTKERLEVIVDVNGYFLDKRAILEQEAKKAAEEATRDQIFVMMRPMLPYERKIIHTFLAKNQNVVTESVGQDKERKIVIRPKIS